MKTTTCDICGRISLDKSPFDWGSFRVSFRWDRKIGSNLFSLDLCKECTKSYDHEGARDLAIKVLKALKK